MGGSMRIGRLHISFNRKSIKPGRPLGLFGFQVLWGNGDTKDIVNSYVSNPDLYTVVNKVARTAAYAPFKVYKIKDKQKHKLYKSWTGENATKVSISKAMQIKEMAYEEFPEHPMNKLLEQPNPEQKGREFMENSVGFKVLTGERFWHIVKLNMGANEGKPFAIYNLPPQYMTVKGDGSLLGLSGYECLLYNNKNLTKEEIIFSRYWNPDYDNSGSHLRGLSPFKAGSRLVTRSTSALTRSVNMLQNAGAAGLLFEKPVAGFDGMSEEQAGALKVKLNTEVLGIDNANTIGVANGDLGYINFGLKGTEMELVELEKLTLEKICLLVNVPPVLFNTDRSIQNNLQEAKKELIISACCPELDSLRDDWNEVAKLYQEDIWVDYDLSIYPELQEDLEKVNKINVASWWKTPNEKRLSEYMDEHPDPKMDEIIIPTGLMLLDDLGANVVDNTLNNDGTGNQQGN
jgi:phage portal protein BeeE